MLPDKLIGKLNNDFEIKSNVFCSIQSGSKSDDLESGSCSLNTIDVAFDDVKNTIRAEENLKNKKVVRFNSRRLIVSVGRGIAKEENIPMAEELTTLLNAEMFKTYCRLRWLPHDRQIGSSGHVVSPKLYFHSVSGAIQHQVGMKVQIKLWA